MKLPGSNLARLEEIQQAKRQDPVARVKAAIVARGRSEEEADRIATGFHRVHVAHHLEPSAGCWYCPSRAEQEPDPRYVTGTGARAAPPRGDA